MRTCLTCAAPVYRPWSIGPFCREWCRKVYLQRASQHDSPLLETAVDILGDDMTSSPPLEPRAAFAMPRGDSFVETADA